MSDESTTYDAAPADVSVPDVALVGTTDLQYEAIGDLAQEVASLGEQVQLLAQDDPVVALQIVTIDDSQWQWLQNGVIAVTSIMFVGVLLVAMMCGITLWRALSDWWR